MYISKIYKNRLKRLKIASFIKWTFLAYSLSVLLFSVQCASIQAPLGGPIDSLPPKLIDETPRNLTRNFSSKKIVISFDEFIKLADQFKQISVSPDMEKLPEFYAKRRDLEITMPDSLEKNTTYTISFGKAITDYNEGNPFLNYSYVFSTGNQIDSLSISGNVRDARTLDPVLEASVLLIPTRQDSIFGKKKANIFKLTDSSGNFTIKNLREDTYRIYALKEENGDRIYNSPSELIAFQADSFHLNKDTSNIHLELFKGIPEKFRLDDRKIEKSGRMTFIFNKSLKKPAIVFRDDELEKTKITEFSKTNDTALVWFPKLTFDTVRVAFYDDTTQLDSVTLRRGKNDKYDRNLLITDNISSKKVDKIKHIQLTSSAPLKSVDRTKIILLDDSVQRNNYQFIKDSLSTRRYTLKYNWRPKHNYSLSFDEGAFIGYGEDEKNKKSTMDFTLEETENYGDMILKMVVPDSALHYIAEITDEKMENTISSRPFQKDTTLTYRQYPGAKYLVRIIYDENANRVWDTGDLYKKMQPEKLWYFEKVITVRPNWEQEEIVTIPSLQQLPAAIQERDRIRIELLKKQAEKEKQQRNNGKRQQDQQRQQQQQQDLRNNQNQNIIQRQ